MAPELKRKLTASFQVLPTVNAIDIITLITKAHREVISCKAKLSL